MTALGYHDDAGQWRTYSVPVFYTAEWPGVRIDPREAMRRSKLYDEHGPRSPLLRRDEWALEVRVYGPGRIRYIPPVFG